MVKRQKFLAHNGLSMTDIWHMQTLFGFFLLNKGNLWFESKYFQSRIDSIKDYDKRETFDEVFHFI